MSDGEEVYFEKHWGYLKGTRSTIGFGLFMGLMYLGVNLGWFNDDSTKMQLVLLLLAICWLTAFALSPIVAPILERRFPTPKHILLTLTMDSLVVDKPKKGPVAIPGFTRVPKGKDVVPLKKLESATFYEPGGRSTLFTWKFPTSVAGTGGVVLKYDNFERFRAIEDAQKFMHSLADRMQRAGIRIAIAGSTEKIKEIINLDAKEKR